MASSYCTTINEDELLGGVTCTKFNGLKGNKNVREHGHGWSIIFHHSPHQIANLVHLTFYFVKPF